MPILTMREWAERDFVRVEAIVGAGRGVYDEEYVLLQLAEVSVAKDVLIELLSFDDDDRAAMEFIDENCVGLVPLPAEYGVKPVITEVLEWNATREVALVRLPPAKVDLSDLAAVDPDIYAEAVAYCTHHLPGFMPPPPAAAAPPCVAASCAPAPPAA
ncbi:hypothetical protein OEZ85_012270 [Tetradesmus obliquus]|uniref:Uncharacterized protein n=1 Tax=Tetradesmus obliquus TaxID=3088 RepID=A0ABY8TV90_TETOB|nr:hypothetical protein OEZ85_012270 [Tetradesmus obliquus]